MSTRIIKDLSGLTNFNNIKESFTNQMEIISSPFLIIEAYKFKEKQLILKRFKNQLQLIENLQIDDDIVFSLKSKQMVLYIIRKTIIYLKIILNLSYWIIV